MSFSHLDEEGRVKMVDVSGKEVTERVAVASGAVFMQPETVAAIRERTTPKGDPLEVARIAGILAAKRTDSLIPLCHSLPLSHADVELTLEADAVRIMATTRTAARTGVEMEALMAVTVAALTIYDMCKAIDKGMRISDVRLITKTGGKSWISEAEEG